MEGPKVEEVTQKSVAQKQLTENCIRIESSDANSLLKKQRDLGFLPEGEIHSRSMGSTPYEMGHDDALYSMESVMDVAELASSLEPGATADLVRAMQNEDSALS